MFLKPYVFFLFFAGHVKKWNSSRDAYLKLKEVPDKALATSGYSEVNLAKLFQGLSTLK